MPAAVLSPPITTEELLAMPENGMDRWLIAGELREKPMTVRNRFPSALMVKLSRCLDNWRLTLPEPQGEVLCGEAGFRLARNPDSTVGVDIAYVPPELWAQQSKGSTIVNGVPPLVVEILSPSDTIGEIDEKISTYLDAGVALVWIIDPYRRVAWVHRPNVRPESVNEGQDLVGDPTLPGFRVPFGDLFR